MSIEAGVGIARGGDGFDAGREAAAKALEQSGCENADAAVVFSSVRYESEDVRRGVMSVLPNAAVVGCSDSGILSSGGVVRGAVGVMVLHGSDLRAVAASADSCDAAPEDAARKLALAAARLSDTAKLHLMLIDGLATRAAVTVGCFQDILRDSGVPIVGGSAADGLSFTRSYQFDSNRSTGNGAALLSIGGGVRIGAGVRHGFTPL